MQSADNWTDHGCPNTQHWEDEFAHEEHELANPKQDDSQDDYSWTVTNGRLYIQDRDCFGNAPRFYTNVVYCYHLNDMVSVRRSAVGNISALLHPSIIFLCAGGSLVGRSRT